MNSADFTQQRTIRKSPSAGSMAGKSKLNINQQDIISTAHEFLMDSDDVGMKRLTGELNRYKRKMMPSPFHEHQEQHDVITQNMTVLERVVLAFMGRNRDMLDRVSTSYRHVFICWCIQFSTGVIYLCAPLAYTLQNETDVYAAFETLMRHLDKEYFDGQSMSYHQNFWNSTQMARPRTSFAPTKVLSDRVLHFMTLFRVAIPDLWNYFQEEEVSCLNWVTSWHQFLLSKELNLECVLRLWDFYWTIIENPHEMLDFHAFVCLGTYRASPVLYEELMFFSYLAILRQCKDQLEELEHSEIQSFLCRLPPLQIDILLQSAMSIRHELASMGLE